MLIVVDGRCRCVAVMSVSRSNSRWTLACGTRTVRACPQSSKVGVALNKQAHCQPAAACAARAQPREQENERTNAAAQRVVCRVR